MQPYRTPSKQCKCMVIAIECNMHRTSPPPSKRCQQIENTPFLIHNVWAFQKMRNSGFLHASNGNLMNVMGNTAPTHMWQPMINVIVAIGRAGYMLCESIHLAPSLDYSLGNGVCLFWLLPLRCQKLNPRFPPGMGCSNNKDPRPTAIRT